MDDLSELEKKALELIESEGEIVQSDLWKKLDCSAGKASEIARKLQEEDYIDRGKTVKNGSSTYKLVPTPKDYSEIDYSLLIADDQISPFVDNDNVKIDDQRFTQWIVKLDEEYDN